MVGYPSGQRGQTVNLLAYAFSGSNPEPTTTSFYKENRGFVQLNQGFGEISGFASLSQDNEHQTDNPARHPRLPRQMDKLGGRSKSPAKLAAIAQNAKKGGWLKGWPRKAR